MWGRGLKQVGSGGGWDVGGVDGVGAVNRWSSVASWPVFANNHQFTIANQLRHELVVRQSSTAPSEWSSLGADLGNDQSVRSGSLATWPAGRQRGEKTLAFDGHG